MKTWVEVIASPWQNTRRKTPGMHVKEIGELLESVRLWSRSGWRPLVRAQWETTQWRSLQRRKGRVKRRQPRDWLMFLSFLMKTMNPQNGLLCTLTSKDRSQLHQTQAAQNPLPLLSSSKKPFSSYKWLILHIQRNYHHPDSLESQSSCPHKPYLEIWYICKWCSSPNAKQSWIQSNAYCGEGKKRWMCCLCVYATIKERYGTRSPIICA